MEVAGLAIFFGYMIHAGILVLIALVKFIIWITNREKTNAGQYVLATFFLLLIGFGACTAMLSIMGGLEGIYILITTSFKDFLTLGTEAYLSSPR